MVASYLAGRSQDVAALFGQVAKLSKEQGVGIEVYDRDARMIAWEGRSGPVQRREVRIALDGQMTSYVSRAPIFSQLFVTTPVREEGTVIGAVLVRRTIDVDYPLNNAYINREGLADQLSRRLGVEVEFNFSPTAELRRDGRYMSTALYGIDSSRVGVVSVLRPARSAYSEGMSAKFQGAYSVVLSLLVLSLAWAAATRLKAIPSGPVRLLSLTAVIWLARFGLLWLDFPSLLFVGGIFNPAIFASKFGGGLAKSIGEMTISTIALGLNTVLLVRVLLAHAAAPGAGRIPGGGAVHLLLVATGIMIFYWLFRGYAAGVRSAVVDSTLQFTDIRVMLPSFDLGVMLLNLFVISWCLIALSGSAAVHAVRLLAGSSARPVRRQRWLIMLMLVVVGAIAFGLLPGEPLVFTALRTVFGIGVVLFGWLVSHLQLSNKKLFAPRPIFVVFGLSAVLFYPLITAYVHEKDRGRIESFAQEVLRPVDSWFTFVVDEALNGFTAKGTADVIVNGDREDVDRLAFSRWAASSACREGYTSIFSVVDISGQELSRFSIGGESLRAAAVDSIVKPSREKSVQVRTIGKGINAIKVYAGSVPIRTRDGVLLGFGRVVVAAGQQTLFRGDNPPILRGSTRENIETFYRPLALSEFRDGVLLTTNNTALPIGYTLPEQVRTTLETHSGTSLWIRERIDENTYDTYYVSRGGGPTDVIALSLTEQGIVWHFINCVKIVLFFAIVSLVLLLAALALRGWRRELYAMTFRDRLLAALLVIAIVPLVTMMIYGRYRAQGRLLQETERRLDGETTTLAMYLLDQISSNTGGIRSSLSPAIADQTASDLGTDFNLYIGNELRLTSRPELYEAGILDSRLSGSAYAGIIVRGKRFHAESESIGLYRYAVGYKPLLDASGAILGIVSVPTLYRQDQIEEETAQRNAFLFAVYAIALFAVILTATTLANRIAAPIHRLTEATRKVSRGELDVTLDDARVDGEVGDLVRSFETMTRDLKKSREELIRYEREMAWKEMAKQVAHEIKNPLTPMKLAIQHLRQTYQDRVPEFDQILDEVTKTIIGQVDALSRIASEFSHFARMPKRKLEACDVNQVVQEAIDLFGQDTSVRFQMDLSNDLPPVTADREELRRAFINVIRNGIQAMGNTGNIRVRSERSGTGTLISIRDFGPGIADEVRRRLFEPNFSTKTDGMGLGLAIVKKTIDDLGGSIAIESTAKGGTTVKMFLPGAAPEGDGR